MPYAARMPVIKADCDAPTKAAFKALAERANLTEMQLLRTLVARVLAAETDWQPEMASDRPIRGKLDVRLTSTEVDAVRDIARSEGEAHKHWWQ